REGTLLEDLPEEDRRSQSDACCEPDRAPQDEERGQGVTGDRGSNGSDSPRERQGVARVLERERELGERKVHAGEEQAHEQEDIAEDERGPEVQRDAPEEESEPDHRDSREDDRYGDRWNGRRGDRYAEQRRGVHEAHRDGREGE